MGKPDQELGNLLKTLHGFRKKNVTTGWLPTVRQLVDAIPEDQPFSVKDDKCLRDLFFFLKESTTQEEVTEIVSLLRKLLCSQLVFESLTNEKNADLSYTAILSHPSPEVVTTTIFSLYNIIEIGYVVDAPSKKLVERETNNKRFLCNSGGFRHVMEMALLTAENSSEDHIVSLCLGLFVSSFCIRTFSTDFSTMLDIAAVLESNFLFLLHLTRPTLPELSEQSQNGSEEMVVDKSSWMNNYTPRIQAMTLLRHLILFSPPHTVKQLQDRAFRCGAMGWLLFGACSPPVAITQPRSQEKEDTSWMSTSIAAEANAVGSSAALHIRDCCRDLFFLLSSPASIEHYLVSLLPQSLYISALVPAPLHPAQTHRTHLFTPLDTKDKQSEPLQLQPSSIAHPLLTSAQHPFVNRHPRAMPPSFPLLHPINLADINISPFYEPAHATSTSLTWHEPNYLLSPFILPPSSFWAMSSPYFFYHNMSPSANSNPHTRHTNGWDTFDQWNISDKKLRQRERQSSVHALWVLRDLIESYTTLVSFSAQETQRRIALKLRQLAKDFQAKTKTSPRTTTENIDDRTESPSEQTKDDPQHTTQHPLPNPFRPNSDDAVKWTAVDADGSGRDLGDPLFLADWDRALSQAKKDGLDVKEGEKMSKLHHFEHTAATFLHTLIRDRMQSEQNAKDALSKQGKSTAKHSKTSSKPQITDYFTEAHSKDFEDAQILTVADKRGHSLLSPVGRMVKEATLTKYGCGEKSSWLEDLLESERELGCLPIPFLPINSGAFWAMFDSDTRSPVLVWGEKDRQELVSFLRNEMEDYAKLCATANKATDAAMKEDATFTLDPDIVSTYSVEESVKSVMVDGKPAFVFPSSMQYQSHANLNKYKRSFAFQPSESKAFSQAQSSNDKSHPALATTQGTITSTLLHPPLVIFPPAPTLSHPRLVFTSSLSHVKVGEYYIDVLMEEYAPVLFLVHQHSVENVAQLLASDERRKAGASKTTTGSAERPPALSAEQLEATPTTQHIDTMRGIDDCSQFARSLFAVSNPLLLAEELMKRIECLGRVFGYLEQGLAESFDIQSSKTSSLSFAALPDLESSLATMRSSQSLQYDLSVLHILLRFCVALSRLYPQTRPALSVIILSSIVSQSVSLIHTIQRTAAGRESSEQFAEHAEFELLVIDYCVKICTTSFALIYTLIHSSKARLLSFKDKNGLALVFSFFNVAPFLSTLYPVSSTVQPDDSLLARSAPRQKTQSPVPLVSISRIESALSHPISFPKAHRVIVSLGSLIPLFASNQMFPLSIGPRSFLYQSQISRYNRSATTKDNFDVLNHLFKVFLHDMPPLSLASLPFAPTKATLARIAKLYTSASSPDAREAVKMEMSVLIKRMSQYAERRHAREEKWNELASIHSQDRHSRQFGCAVCTAMIQLGKEESADFEATRASLYLHLNTAIKLKQRPPNSFCNMQSAVGRWNVIKTSADADFDETEFRDERVSSFILSYHDDKLDLHGNPITHAKEETAEDATDEELDTPSPSSAMDDRKSESPHLKQTPALSPSISTQATTPPSPTTPGTFPRLASRPVSQRALAISSPSLPRGQSSLARSSSFTLQDTPTPFSDSVPSEAEEGQATDLTTQLQDEEDDENFDAMDEFRQFSLQKSFGGRGSEWGGASSGGRGGLLTNLFACFPLSIPPHADAQKTNDMAFPPSTRLKMHKEEVDLVSAVQYVCMITDLLLKDDMVTFDDTTRSGSVSPYSEALHIISRCLLTPSPVARSAVFVLLLSLFRADKVRKVGEMYQTCMVESGLVHFTLSALRFGVTAEHCAFLKYLVVVENAWASAATKAECSYVDPDEAITLSFGSNKEFMAFFKPHGTSSFVPFISKCLPPNLLSTLFVCSPKAPSSDPLIHLSPLPFPSTYVPPSPTALLISDHHSIPLTAFTEYFNAAFFPSTSSVALDSFAVSQRLWTPQAVSTLNATTDLLLDSFFAKWEANPFSTFIHTTPPVLLDTVCINTRESFLSLLKQIRAMPLIPLFTPLHSPLTIPHPPLCIVDYSPSLAADVFLSPSFSLTSVQSLFTSLFEDSWQNGAVPSPLFFRGFMRSLQIPKTEELVLPTWPSLVTPSLAMKQHDSLSRMFEDSPAHLMFLQNVSFPILTFLRSDEMAELSSVSDLRGTGILLSDLIEQIVMSEDLTQPRLSLFEGPQTSATPSRVPLAAACLQTLICLLTVDPTLPLLFTPEDQCNIFNINFILHALKLLLAHSEIMLNSSGAESPLSQSASLTSPTPSSQELFGDSLFLPFLLSPLLHYLHAVLSVSLLHPLGPNERSLIEQFVDEDGVIILHRLYCIVFSPLLVGYLDVLTQRQTNSDILKTPFSQQFLASFTSTLFHLLSIIMLSYENLTKQQTLSFSKGHKSAGPLGKEFKSKFDLPNVFKSPTNSHKAQSASESFTLVDDSDLLLLKENDQKAEPARVLSPTARTSPTANPPLRLFNPRQSLRMSIVRQPTPVTPQKFTAGRSTPPLDDSLPEEISGDMRLAFVQHPATRFESDDSDSEPPPPPSEPPSPGPPTPEPTSPPENEEWESDVLLPSPPQTMPTLTQRRQRMLLVSVQIITHSLSLLIPPVCDDFTRLLNLGTNRASPNEKASEERIVDPTQIPDTIPLSVVLDSTQQFTFDMSAARKGYNVGHDAVLHTLLHYSLAAFLMLFNEAFHATSFNLTQNPQRMETLLIVDRHDPRLNQVSNDAFNEAEAEAVKTKKSSSGLLYISAIEENLIPGLLFIALYMPATLPVPDYAPLPPMSISFGGSKEQAFPESATKPLHYLSSMLTIPTPSLLAFEAMRALYFLLKCNKTAIDRAFTHLHVNSIPEIPRAFKTQLVKNSGIFYAWRVGQDETAKTEFQIRKGKLRWEADRLVPPAQLRRLQQEWFGQKRKRGEKVEGEGEGDEADGVPAGPVAITTDHLKHYTDWRKKQRERNTVERADLEPEVPSFYSSGNQMASLGMVEVDGDETVLLAERAKLVLSYAGLFDELGKKKTEDSILYDGDVPWMEDELRIVFGMLSDLVQFIRRKKKDVILSEDATVASLAKREKKSKKKNDDEPTTTRTSEDSANWVDIKNLKQEITAMKGTEKVKLSAYLRAMANLLPDSQD